jgi:hypothetical protein
MVFVGSQASIEPVAGFFNAFEKLWKDQDPMIHSYRFHLLSESAYMFVEHAMKNKAPGCDRVIGYISYEENLCCCGERRVKKHLW